MLSGQSKNHSSHTHLTISPTSLLSNHRTRVNPSHAFLHMDLVETTKPNPVRSQALSEHTEVFEGGLILLSVLSSVTLQTTIMGTGPLWSQV